MVVTVISTMKPSVYSVVLNNFLNDSRVKKEAVSLASNGYQVTVVALWENGLQISENFTDFSLIRIKLVSRNWPRILPFQVLKYLEFVVRAFFLVRKGDFIHCNDLDALTVGYFCKIFRFPRKAELKVIYDAHELETEVNGLTSFRKKIAKILEKTMIGKADALITVCDSIAEIYMDQYQIEKPFVVRNIPQFEEVNGSSLLRQIHDIPANKFVFISQGMLSPGRGLEILLDIAEQNQEDDFVVVFMGKGILEERIQASAFNFDNVVFQPFVKSEEIISYTSSADCGICFFEDNCLSHHYVLPNKMFEYMMAEIPIVVSNLPEMQKFADETGVGFSAEQGSHEDLSRVMRKVMRLEKSAIKKKLIEAKKSYNWEGEEIVLLEAYKSA